MGTKERDSWWFGGLQQTWDGAHCESPACRTYVCNEVDLPVPHGCRMLKSTCDPHWGAETGRAFMQTSLMLALQRAISYLTCEAPVYLWPKGKNPSEPRPTDYWLSEDMIPELAGECPHLTLRTGSGLCQPLFVEDRQDTNSPPCLLAVWVVTLFKDGGAMPTVTTRRHSTLRLRFEHWGSSQSSSLAVWDPTDPSVPAAFDRCTVALAYSQNPQRPSPIAIRSRNPYTQPINSGCTRHYEALMAFQYLQRTPWWVEKADFGTEELKGDGSVNRTFFFSPCDDLNISVNVWTKSTVGFWYVRKMPVSVLFSRAHCHCFFTCSLWGMYERSSATLTAPTMKALLGALLPLMSAVGWKPKGVSARFGGVPPLGTLARAACFKSLDMNSVRHLELGYELPYKPRRPLRTVLDLPDVVDCFHYEGSPAIC
ncbi:protein ORF111 [Cyprinid herpesvirus 1]|uniref:Protein ORF111 n=1 Tax=Cyprinid herpesvirus 1 TaxID=317858 RepID=K7PBM2_9VIRU|nr:protein ORF111 [Cyprinid herpesvirus 1]AFJ20406.1 protein ORF111 [Cyprinid herpesvirus 1]